FNFIVSRCLSTLAGKASRAQDLNRTLSPRGCYGAGEGFEPSTQPWQGSTLCCCSEKQVKMVARSRNHLRWRRLQVMIDAGPRNYRYLLGQQVKIRSCPPVTKRLPAGSKELDSVPPGAQTSGTGCA